MQLACGDQENQRLGIKSYPSFVVLDPQGRFLGYKLLLAKDKGG
ncbi:hypothetical protein ABT392_15085 [Paucibacter sp. JuS9]